MPELITTTTTTTLSHLPKAPGMIDEAQHGTHTHPFKTLTHHFFVALMDAVMHTVQNTCPQLVVLISVIESKLQTT